MKYSVVVIDGNNLLYRAFYAHQDKAVGVVSTIRKIVCEYSSAIYICVFDKPKSNLFRGYLTEAYKGGRTKKFNVPEAVAKVTPMLKQLGIHVWGAPDAYEADDVIGTIAEDKGTPEFKSLIVSGDKDFLQLVSKSIDVVLIRNGGVNNSQIHNILNFKSLRGVEAKEYLTYKTLNGDKSDNVQGVSGIGHKTSCKLIGQHHTLPNIVLSNEFKRYIPQGADISSTFRLLVQAEYVLKIHTNVPLVDIEVF